MDRTRDEAAAARRAYADEHGSVSAPEQERRSVGDVLHDPYAVAGATLAAQQAINAAKARLRGSGGKHKAGPEDKD